MSAKMQMATREDLIKQCRNITDSPENTDFRIFKYEKLYLPDFIFAIFTWTDNPTLCPESSEK